jgi:hypothetical protein
MQGNGLRPVRGEQNAVAFFAKHGLRCERFTEQERRQGKTPDFKVFKEAEFVLYSEAKHIQEDNWLEDLMTDAPPLAIVGGTRHDPAFNKLGGHIYQAAKQFLAVNPNGDYPNVLVLTSSDKGCTFSDLISTITGNFYAESGAVDPIYKSENHRHASSHKGCRASLAAKGGASSAPCRWEGYRRFERSR